MPGAEGQAAVPVLVDGLPDKTDTSGVYEQYKGYWGEISDSLRRCFLGILLIATGDSRSAQMGYDVEDAACESDHTTALTNSP